MVSEMLYILGSELAHFLFGSFVSLVVALPGYFLISIMRPNMSSISRYRAGFYILLFSCSAAMAWHALEDFTINWF